MRHSAIFAVLVLVCSCATSSSSGGNTVPPRDADAITVDGLKVRRPNGWVFVPIDGTSAADTVAVLHGPDGVGLLRPTAEIARRPLNAADQRRKTSHILTQLVTELVQLFDAFEAMGEPEDLEIGGHPAARVRLKFTEGLPDGRSQERLGEFYGIVRDGQIWLFRFLDEPTGSSAGAFQTILNGLEWG